MTIVMRIMKNIFQSKSYNQNVPQMAFNALSHISSYISRAWYIYMYRAKSGESLALLCAFDDTSLREGLVIKSAKYNNDG